MTAIFDFDAIAKAMRDLKTPEPDRDEELPYCHDCEDGGWEGYFTPTGGGPNFRVCEKCGNPRGIPRP